MVRDDIPFFNEEDRKIMRGVREEVRSWKEKDTRRWIITSREYGERARKGLPLDNVMTLAEAMRKAEAWKESTRLLRELSRQSQRASDVQT